MPSPSQPAGPHELGRTAALVLVAEFVAIVVTFVALSTAAGDPATACGWCQVNVFDAAMRDLVVARAPRLPATVSHVLSMVLAPMLAFGAVVAPALRARRRAHAAQDAAIVLNAFLLTVALTDCVKKLAARQRPGFHFGRGALTEAAATPVEQFLSFFSGDTSLACALVAAGATLAHLRGHRGARGVAVAGAILGTGTAVMRMAADMHWATDVLAGATVGTAVGVALPRVVHPRAAR